MNSVAGSWWQQVSYGQTSFEFTVLSDPQTADGWWPAPHSWQDYGRNNGNWYQTTTNIPPSYALVPDVTANVVQSICSNPLLLFVCQVLPSYNRLVILQNVHSFGDQSLGNDFPFTIATGTALGNLVVSASWANEDSTDSGVTSLMHELGHQSGELSHYGDCSAYFSFTSFNSTLPASGAECISGWDIMGISYSLTQFSGYSRVSRGWINAANTPSFDLISGGPFTQTFLMNPLEVPPTDTNPNVIRLSIGDLSWPTFSGYFVECREPIGGDVPSPFPSIPVSTIPDQGVLITNIHEFSVSDIPGAPAHHVERTLFPADQLTNATLKPGQTFSDSVLGLSIRFNGYVGGDAKVRQCSVSIAHLESLPPPQQRIIRFAGSAILNGLAQTQDTASISSDIAINDLIDADARVRVPIPLVPPWTGHKNQIFVRVHDRSTGAVDNVNVGVSVQQPAVIANVCAAAPKRPNLGTVNLKQLVAGSSALAELEWTTAKVGSVSVEAVASGPANRIHTSTRFAFQFHHQDIERGGVRTQFKIASDPSCMMPETYFVAPAVSLPDWKVQAMPSAVTLKPGQDAVITVLVTPPAKRRPGQHAELPVVVRMQQQMLTDTGRIPKDTPANLIPGVHYMALGAITILAKVTAGPGSVDLHCKQKQGDDSGQLDPCIGHIDRPLAIRGAVSPKSANSPTIVEYRSPSGTVITHLVLTDENGNFRDSVVPQDRGRWKVQARWSGGEMNDPTESSTMNVDVRWGR
ncbi:hypothetical protein FSO04_30890 [Paraburkholderia madseniana]|uniref:Uncharacterized protein n=1 Tax=Paraburkholderia madseniana TaxID=2599607 RepID=A0A6N6W6R1_9BURK|nr:hypothetical protein [Paraburkholderia madseniana]KAE8756113.1 hypothetical protein FSO04_30890 [Paraburkholderia madseniana]